MTWLTTKTAIAKVWVWCKHNWKIVALLIYTVLLYLLFSKNARNAKKMLDDARAAHKAELQAIEEAHEEQLRQRDENLKKYNETMAALEKKLKEKGAQITKDRERKVKKIIEEAKDDPNNLAELIKQEFGFDIWEK